MFEQDLIAALDAGYTVLTPGGRLAREIGRDFARNRIRAGVETWSSPTVMSIGAWLKREYNVLQWAGPAAGGERMLLTPIASRYLWEQVIRSVSDEISLMDVPAAARQAAKAWADIQGWRLPDPAAANFAGDDLKLFSRWMRAYHDTLTRQSWIDDSRLPDILRKAYLKKILPAPRIALHAFADFSPQIDELWQAVVSAGGAVQLVERVHARTNAVRVKCSDERDEIDAAARWARDRVESLGGNAAIGVVVPGLSNKSVKVKKAFDSVFAPGAIIPGQRPAQCAYAMIERRPIAQTAIAQAALAIVTLARWNIPASAIYSLLTSPFTGNSEREHVPRARFLSWLSRYPRSRMSIVRLAERAARWFAESGAPGDAFELAVMLQKASVLVRDTERQKPGAWGDLFGRLLSEMGWPGPPVANADIAQAREAVRNALAQMGSLDIVLSKIAAPAAISVFRQLLETGDLAGDPSPLPVRVLDVDVAEGLCFDALWMCGWNADAFPRAAEPNPFIPQAWGREKGLPHSNASAMLEDARRVTERLLSSAPVAVVSWSADSASGEHLPSHLINELPLQAKNTLSLWSGPDPLGVIGAALGSETINDPAGPPLTATVAPGGTAALKLQSACPFRAFAECRLNARAPLPVEAGLDALERGALVHGVLELSWAAIGTHENLLAATPEDLETQLMDFADKALHAHETRRGRLPARFRELEQRRLVRLVHEWLVFEGERQSFTVVGKETDRILTLGGLDFKLRLDRVDQVEDAGLVLIDYKTSRNNSERHWAGSRPDEPQLPMYALTLGKPLLAVLFAEVRAGEMRFRGVASSDGLVPGVGRFKGIDDQAMRWEELAAYWRERLEVLARNFKRGDAAVDPKNRASTCRTCDLDAVCRISEREKSQPESA